MWHSRSLCRFIHVPVEVSRLYSGLKTVLAIACVAALSAQPHAASAQPHVSILSPAAEQIVAGPDVRVRFAVDGASLRPGGTNLHFMLDNEPFEVQYDSSHPHVFKDVKPGTHTIRAFVTNMMHEAIRGSMDMVTFSVAYPDAANRQCPGVPTLTYNLPQGEYLGIDAADITLDYLVTNINLARGGNKVTYSVDGRRFFAEDGMPRHLTGLRAGYHVLRIELQDENGDTIEGPFNSVERTILVSPDQSTNSAGVQQDKYPPGVPHIASLHGSMTMGKSWKAVEKPRPMTQEQIRQSQRLTVRHGSGAKAAVTEKSETDVLSAVPGVTESTTHETHPQTVTEPATETAVETRTDTETNAESPRASVSSAPVHHEASLSDVALTTSGRKLDNRLERANQVSETTTLRADAPTSAGRSVVHKVKVPNSSTSQTVTAKATVTTSTQNASTPAVTPIVTPVATPITSAPAAATATPVVAEAAVTPASTPIVAAPTPTVVSSTPASVLPTIAAGTNTTSGTSGAK